MEINFEINNTVKNPIKKSFFALVAEKTFFAVGHDFLNPSFSGKKINISLALVSPEEIRRLNKKYRKHDSVTDILSFPEYKNSKEIERAILGNSEGEIFLGELILCYDDVKEYAAKEGLEFEKELSKVTSHGILHLLGFSHGKKMFALQDLVAKNQ